MKSQQLLSKKAILTWLSGLFILTSASAQTPCVGGMAGVYPCHDVDLVSYLSNANTGGGNGNDVWGWTSPTGREFVIYGKSTGTAFIEITIPTAPAYKGFLPTHTTNSTWRDIKVYADHAFIVSEAGNHGMQIFDLTQLLPQDSYPLTFTETAYYDGFGDAHNIVINEESARAYAVGTNTFGGGLHIMDISDPLNPVLIGDFTEGGYVHDAQVVIYNGPDADYIGREIAMCCNGSSFKIADVTNASDVVQLATTGYTGQGYIHQGWLTDDHKYFLLGDEGDENGSGVNTTTYIWDVQDLTDPQLIGSFVSTEAAIDHNQYITGGFNFQSNYRAGLRILDIENVANAVLTEVAFFDVVPADNNAGFSGSWSNYPYFPSGHVAVTSIGDGIFLVKPNALEGCTDPSSSNYSAVASVDDGSCDAQGCAADYNNDNVVNTQDLLILLSEFGCVSGCLYDLDGDDIVNTQDLLIFLAQFGSPC